LTLSWDGNTLADEIDLHPKNALRIASADPANSFAGFFTESESFRSARRPLMQFRKSYPSILFLAIALGATAARASQAPVPPATTVPKPTAQVTDELGRKVKVTTDVRRIVSLAPNLTETVYALGLQERLAGDTDYCDYPKEAAGKPHVGGPMSPSIEAIVALQPDLVLATTSINRVETVAALERVGIAVYVSDPHSVEGLLAGIRKIADITGASASGKSMVDDLQARLDSLHASLNGSTPCRVLFVVWSSPLISIGQGTFIADALKLAGAESVVKSTRNWPEMSLEEVIRLRPEYLVFARGHDDPDAGNLDALRKKPVYRDLKPVREGHVVSVSDSIDRPAPRMIDAIEALAHQLHPEVFAALRDDFGPRDWDSASWLPAKAGAKEGYLCGR
jgi:iron complex transport system substrate-binding protein